MLQPFHVPHSQAAESLRSRPVTPPIQDASWHWSSVRGRHLWPWLQFRRRRRTASRWWTHHGEHSMAAAKKACAKHRPSPAGVPGRSFMRTPRGCETCACGATAGGGGGASTGYNAGRLAPHRLRFCSARSALQQRPADRGAPVPETLPGQQPRLARQRVRPVSSLSQLRIDRGPICRSAAPRRT